MSTPIATLVAALEDFLRYVAPGFVAIASLMIGSPGFNNAYGALLVSQPEFLFLSGFILGVVLNSAHVAVLEDLFCFPVVWCYRRMRKAKLPAGLERRSTWDLMRELEIRRELRRTSNDERTVQFQRRHDRLGATLTFLYCASYPGLFVGLAFKAGLLSSIDKRPVEAGRLLFGFAVICGFRYTSQDIWAASRFAETERMDEDLPRASNASPSD